jgi:hypothetical protein
MIACDSSGNRRTEVVDDVHEVSMKMVENIVIQDSDSLYVGAPSGFAVDSSTGAFLVGDRFHGFVLKIDRGGRILEAIGSRGRGPGEFLIPRAIASSEDGIIITDAIARKVSRFSANEHLFEASRNVHGLPSGVVDHADGWIVGNISPVDGLGASGINSFEGLEEQRFARWPQLYHASTAIPGIFTSVLVESWSDTVAVLYQAADTIYRFATEKFVEVPPIPIPLRHRRGAALERAADMDQLAFPDMFARFSAAFLLHRAPNGDLIVGHFDQSIADGNAVDVVVWISRISTTNRTSRSCVDMRVPLPADLAGQPRLAAHGDTVFALLQRVGIQGGLTEIRGWLPPREPC